MVRSLNRTLTVSNRCSCVAYGRKLLRLCARDAIAGFDMIPPMCAPSAVELYNQASAVAAHTWQQYAYPQYPFHAASYGGQMMDFTG